MVKKPTRREFDGCCNEFLWVSIYVAKGLWRDQVLYAQAHLNDPVRLEMMKMLDWYIGVNTDFSVTTGKCGKYLREYLDEKSWVKLLKPTRMEKGKIFGRPCSRWAISSAPRDGRWAER